MFTPYSILYWWHLLDTPRHAPYTPNVSYTKPGKTKKCIHSMQEKYTTVPFSSKFAVHSETSKHRVLKTRIP